MADSDQTTTDAQPTEPATPVVDQVPVTPVPNPLETTTAKDGDLLVNKPTAPEEGAPVAEAAAPVPVAPDPAEQISVPDQATAPVTPPENPIVVSDTDVSASTNPSQVADEIETLSGEIQALEAKIDRLASSVTTEPVKSEADKSMSVPKAETAAETTVPIVVATPAATPESTPKSLIDTKPSGAVNDIYNKHVTKGVQDAETQDTAIVGEGEGHGGSAIGTIGEVLMIFGVVIFFIMVVSPFAKEIVGTNIWDAIRTIGWPTAGLSLIVGLLFSLFAKGNGLLKVLAVILLLLSAIMYLSVSGNNSLLGPLQTWFGPLFTFYQ